MSTQTLELSPRENHALAKRQDEPTVGDILRAVVERGIKEQDAKVVETLAAIMERQELRNAEKAFAVAFNALQAEMPKVQARKAVPNNDGSVRYKYAAYEQIMEQVSPFLLKHGFTITFSQDFAEGRMIESCTLQHIGGHSRTNKFAVRVGSGPRGTNEAQADGAAATYAKRFALCNALNITIEQEMSDDPRAEGGAVTAEQADELERRVALTNSNKAAFLKLAGAQTYREIKAGKYEVLDNFLRMKEAKGR